MMPVIRIGPAAMQTASLALIVALWIGAYIADREARRRTLRGDDAWTVITIFLFASVIAGRLIFFAQNIEAYSTDWTEVFSLSPNTLVLDLGALCGLVIASLYIWWKRIPFARFTDALAIGALVALIIIAVGQFFSGDGYGTPTDIPWAISFFEEMRHPTQIYEVIVLAIGFVVVKRAIEPRTRDGVITWAVIAWYGGTHLFIDAFRGDVLLFANGYRLPQVYGFIALMIGMLGLMRIMTNGERRTTEDR
jgi:phosphatidylglycerol:prolipoprotein diacylglycerol transferase